MLNIISGWVTEAGKQAIENQKNITTKREWQGLTDKEWMQIHDQWMASSYALNTKDFVRAIEQALKEKNHPPRPEPARKPMTEEEIGVGLEGWDWHPERESGFYLGVRWAEKHHGITE